MTVVTDGNRRVSIAASPGERVARPSRVSGGDRRMSAGDRLCRVPEPGDVVDGATRRRPVDGSAARLHVAREPYARPGAVRVVRRASLRPVGAVPGEVASCTVRPARRPLRALIWIGVLTAAVVVGLAVLGAFGSAGSVPTATTVVQVQAGQTLSEIAANSAPGSDRTAVIARIEELNGLSSTSVDAGQPLVVPVSGPAGR